MTHRPLHRSLALVVAVLAGLAAACGGDSTGPDADNSVQVTMRKAGAAPGPVSSTSPTPFDGTGGDIVTLADVQSLDVTVNRIEVLPVSADGQDGWVSVSVVGDSQTVDLLTLPESGAGTSVASSDLEPGDYHNVRLFFTGATVTFRDSVTVRGIGDGSETTFEGGTAHDLRVPSAGETGLKLNTASFTVPATEGANTVRVLVDVTASVGTLAVSAEGLIMDPSLTADTGAEDSGSGS